MRDGQHHALFVAQTRGQVVRYGRVMYWEDDQQDPQDRANTARLREIAAEHGWPGHQLVGEAAAHAAWLLAQHAPSDFQDECLPLLEDAVARGDASPRDLAYLMDRALMHRSQPQIYGTQYLIRDGVLTLWTVQEPGSLAERRAPRAAGGTGQGGAAG